MMIPDTQASAVPSLSSASVGSLARGRDAPWREHQLTFAAPCAGTDLLRHLEPLLSDGSSVFHADLFGSAAWIEAARAQLLQLGIQAPETAVLSHEGTHGGMQLRIISGVQPTPLRHGGRIIGNFFEDADAKYCLLGDVRSADLHASPGGQTREVLDILEGALHDAGMEFRDVIRTWYYNDRILGWYDDFNHVRTEFFKRHDLPRMPASTGVGAANPAGAALVAKAIAVRPKTEAVRVRQMDSPLQCDAFAYGSAFSRAMEVATPHVRSIYVSGTASIEPGGKTIHIGNTVRQIETTMEVVGALLSHAGMHISDTTRAIAYFRHGGEMHLWREYCETHGQLRLPVIVTRCDVCRDDLLFEIELDASVPVLS